MLPIFNEYRKMLNNFNVDLSMYSENKLWIDRLIIRGINKEGQIKKICRLTVTDDLKYDYKFYSDMPKDSELINWNEAYEYYKDDILKKEQESLDIIKTALQKYLNYTSILTTSMGKDSKLTEYLLRKITTNYQPIFNNTTLDCADVYKEVKQRKDIKIITPKLSNGDTRSFYKMIEKYGTPSRFSRWCCSYFKEGATSQYLQNKNNIMFFMGMRNEESNTRSEYGWVIQNPNWNNSSWIGILPIRKWTEIELWLYTIYNNIPINPKYLKGYSRVGCHVACPYYTKSTWVLDKYWFPKAYNRFYAILEKDFKDNEKWTRMNCTCKEYHLNWNGGQVRNKPTDDVVKEFMDYKGLDNVELSRQYFTKRCMDCGKNVYKKDEVAMNLKMFGRNINKFKCKKCLMKEFNWSKEDWDNQVKRFKDQNCKLF
jgi:phosphoadenosine phosphosulfate reductase